MPRHFPWLSLDRTLSYTSRLRAEAGRIVPRRSLRHDGRLFAPRVTYFEVCGSICAECGRFARFPSGSALARARGMEQRVQVCDRRAHTARGGRRATDRARDEFCVETRVQLASLMLVVQRLADAVQALTAERHRPDALPDSPRAATPKAR